MTFSSGDDFTFTPDSKHLVFTAVPAKNEAWNTNYDLCRVSINNTSPEWETLTKDNPAADSGPKFTLNGKWLAWRAQDKPGYEADKWEIFYAKVKPDGTLVDQVQTATNDTPQSVNEFAWGTPFGNDFVFVADEEGESALYFLTSVPRKPRRLTRPGCGAICNVSVVGLPW
jgi:Tol biopolymer transport system component